MKKQGEPLATAMAISTIVIIGASTRHCMKKYSHGGMGKHGILVRFRRRRPWKVV